jgi:SAM-dependent methyltransferase
MDIFTLIMILIILVLTFIAWTQLFGAPWIPTRHQTVHRMLELAQIKPGELVYDLGSGDGRIIIEAAQSFGARAVGIEIDPLRYLWSKVKISLLKYQNRVDVILGNFYHQDLSRADVIIVYLLQDTNIRLMQKFERELRHGTRIISNTFNFPGWDITNQDEKEKVYVYKI